MIGITSTAKGKGLNKSPKTALSPTFQPNTKTQNQLIYSNLKECRCKPQNSPVWLVQGAAIYINIAAPCTTEIHTENQHLTLLVKPRVQPRFLHHLLILCFSCNPVIPKNKKSPKHFPFSVKIPIFASVPRAERSNAAKPAQLPNRYRLPNFLLFKSYLPTDYKKTIVFYKKTQREKLYLLKIQELISHLRLKISSIELNFCVLMAIYVLIREKGKGMERRLYWNMQWPNLNLLLMMC